MADPASRADPADGETREMNADAVAPELKLASRPSHVTVHRSHRRPLGAHPVPLLGAAGSVLLLVAIVLMASGSIVAGLAVLVIAAALFGLFAGGVRREPGAPAAEPAVRAAGRLQSLAAFAGVATRAWTGAGWQLVRIRRRQHALRRELRATLAPLGEAVHRDDELQAGTLKRKAATLELKLDEGEREAAALLTAVRQRLERERAGIETTHALSVSREDS